MSLHDYAETQLNLAGYGPDSEEMNSLMGKQILELIDLFASHGHSGFSAPYAIQSFSVLANYKPLVLIEDVPEQWMDCTDNSYQHKYMSSIFKKRH